MKIAPPPLRFLMLTIGGWACMRAMTFDPDQPPRPLVSPVTAAAAIYSRPVRASSFESRGRPLPFKAAPWIAAQKRRSKGRARRRKAPVIFAKAGRSRPIRLPSSNRSQASSLDLAPFRRRAKSSPGGRWSGSAWIFVRRGGARQLAAGGLLGGSQAGARLTYRLSRDAARPVQLSARFYAPLSDAGASEAAIGIAWKPLAALPIELLAERRQALGPAGRSAFSLVAYGGVSERPVFGRVRLDAYAQAGVVGLKTRDLFADGSMRLTVPLDSSAAVKAGVGLWGAAQPGLSRLDIGPHLSVRLPHSGIRLSADWRLRAVGNAAPASGPALTLSADF